MEHIIVWLTLHRPIQMLKDKTNYLTRIQPPNAKRLVMISIVYSLMMTLLAFALTAGGPQVGSVHLIGTWGLGRLVSTFEELFSGLIELQCSDFTVGGTDWDWDLRSVFLVSNNLFNMDGPSLSVDGKNLARLTSNTIFNATSLDLNSISLSYWNWSAIVLSSEFLAQKAAHHSSSNVRWSGEVSLSWLSSLAGNTYGTKIMLIWWLWCVNLLVCVFML